MSKQNKANKTNYVQAGRLTPDDMARERAKMRTVRGEGAQGHAGNQRRKDRGDRASVERVSDGEPARQRGRSGPGE